MVLAEALSFLVGFSKSGNQHLSPRMLGMYFNQHATSENNNQAVINFPQDVQTRIPNSMFQLL